MENKKFLLATIDYFTKWIKAKPLPKIRKMDVIKFICRNIVSRFGMPRAFVSNNKTLLVGQKVKNLLGQLKIKFYKSTMSYL